MLRKSIPYLFWIYATALFIGSIIPWSVNGKVSLVDFSFRIDYFLHFVSFFGLTFLFLLYRLISEKQQELYQLFFQMMIIPAFAIIIELLQWAIPGRSFNILDFIADSIGILLALIIVYSFRFIILRILLKERFASLRN